MRPGSLLRTGWSLTAPCAGHAAFPAWWWALDLRSAPERSLALPAKADRELLVAVDVPGVGGLLAGHPDESVYGRLYRDMALRCGQDIVAAIAAVASHLPDPVVVGCSLGKDRTGLVVALILSLIGVPDLENLATDRAARVALGACPAAMGQYARLRGITPAELRRRLTLGTSAIGCLLTWITEEHRGTESFLRAQGMSSGTISAMRRGLSG
jgi:protein-tyrosine phosphatase